MAIAQCSPTRIFTTLEPLNMDLIVRLSAYCASTEKTLTLLRRPAGVGVVTRLLDVQGRRSSAVEALENVTDVASDLAVGIAQPRDETTSARVRGRTTSIGGAADDYGFLG